LSKYAAVLTKTSTLFNKNFILFNRGMVAKSTPLPMKNAKNTRKNDEIRGLSCDSPLPSSLPRWSG
jgi:hypothetical protein